MAYQLITCPETAHLELIEHDWTPLGLLVQACSRFRPPDCVQCPRSCAARMDRRALGAVRAADIDEDSAADPTSVEVARVV